MAYQAPGSSALQEKSVDFLKILSIADEDENKSMTAKGDRSIHKPTCNAQTGQRMHPDLKLEEMQKPMGAMPYLESV